MERMLAGEARISAGHVNGAVEFANKTIDRIASSTSFQGIKLLNEG